MSLPPSDYIISTRSFDETWHLVANAIQESSSEQFSWRIDEDRPGHRLTATMEYKKPLRLKRRLLLEVNFLRAADDKITLELNYDISPAFNTTAPQEILRKTKNAIAAAVAPEARIYSSQQALPPDLSDPEDTAKGTKGIMRGVEIVLVFCITLLIVQSVISPAGLSTLLLILLMLSIPAGFAAVLYLAWRARADKEGRQRTAAEKMAAGFIAILCGAALCIVALPIILLGLCVGALTLSVAGR